MLPREHRWCSKSGAHDAAKLGRSPAPNLVRVTELSDDVIAFLSEGTRTAMVGYVAADGRPLVAPVWFVVDDGQLAFNTGKDTAKGRALARDPRVVICVDDPHPPYSFVQVQGVASLGEDPDDLVAIATRTGGRYMGAAKADEYGRRNGVPGELVVRVRPTKVIKAFDLAE
jgi:PPOX class probable F420-dependent enzyme